MGLGVPDEPSGPGKAEEERVTVSVSAIPKAPLDGGAEGEGEDDATNPGNKGREKGSMVKASAGRGPSSAAYRSFLSEMLFRGPVFQGPQSVWRVAAYDGLDRECQNIPGRQCDGNILFSTMATWKVPVHD